MTQHRVWVYGDNVNTDVIFPGKYTYTLKTPEEIADHALEDLDPTFAEKVQPGDVIATGTPPGVGLGMKPPTFLKAGDVMKLHIQGLGEQTQTVVPFRE